MSHVHSTWFYNVAAYLGCYTIKVVNNKTNTSNITFKQVFDEYIYQKSKQVKKQTVLKEMNMYKYFKAIENKKINDLNLTLYKQLHFQLDSYNYSVDFKNKILGLFKRVIVYSNKYYNTSDSILKYIERFKKINEFKKEMAFFTYDEFNKFISVIDNQEYKTFFLMLYYLGLRQGECCALTWNDINLSKRTISINKTLTTKIKGEKWTISTPKTKNSIRVLPLPNLVVNDLKTMYNNATNYKDFTNNWFVFGNTRPFAETSIQKKKNDYCKKANLHQIRVHDFRHSCASLLINKGASISLVSKYLGHSNITITLNTYTHMYKSELEDMTKILNNL